MLSLEIQEFVAMLNQMNVVGCILVAERDQARLMENIRQADLILSPTAQAGRVTYYPLEAESSLSQPQAPALFVITEESYSASASLQEKIREQADYFFNVKASGE